MGDFGAKFKNWRKTTLENAQAKILYHAEAAFLRLSPMLILMMK